MREPEFVSLQGVLSKFEIRRVGPARDFGSDRIGADRVAPSEAEGRSDERIRELLQTDPELMV